MTFRLPFGVHGIPWIRPKIGPLDILISPFGGMMQNKEKNNVPFFVHQGEKSRVILIISKQNHGEIKTNLIQICSNINISDKSSKMKKE